MIKLSRKAPTDPGRSHLQAKAARLAALQSAGKDIPAGLKNAYRDVPVKAALVEESCGKCGYCESKILDAQFGDVEHIRPKAQQPALRLDYENLVLSCTRCNTSKTVRYDAGEHHIDPYRDDPCTYLLFGGPLIMHSPGGNRLGQVTEHVFDLNRTDLFESRRERLKAIEALAAVYADSKAGLQKQLARSALDDQAGRCGEYSMTVRAYLRLAFPNDGF